MAAGDPGGGKAIDTSAPKIASSSLAIKFAKEPEKYDRCNDLPPTIGPIRKLVHHSLFLHGDDAFGCGWSVSEG